MVDFEEKQKILKAEILASRIHYIVFAHGADSHEWDELAASQLTTRDWIRCSEMVYSFVKEIQEITGKQIPLVLTLFGGYRKDDFDSVLSLHTAALVKCLNILSGIELDYKVRVKERIVRGVSHFHHEKFIFV